jgi:hypothetical protein
MPVDPSLAALDEFDAPEQDTPETPVETPAPVEDTPNESPTIDWEKRYNDLRSFADRRANEYQQELEQLRQSQQAQQQPSPEYVDDEDEDPVVSYVQQLQARQDALEQQLRARAEADTQKEQQERWNAHIDAGLDAYEAKHGELDDDDAGWIVDTALRNRDEFGNPDVQLALHKWNQMLERHKSKWVSSKPTSARPATGPGAVEVPDLDDPEQLEEYLDRAFGGF